MSALGKRPSSVCLNSGDTITVLSEAAQFSIPEFRVKVPKTALGPYLISQQIIPMGTRVTYSIMSSSQVPVPVLYLKKDSEKGGAPLSACVLKDTVNPLIVFDKITKIIHMLWWWNVWNPGTPPPLGDSSKLPQPPKGYYESHSVPDMAAPAWLRSLVPKAQVYPFDPTQPFWVAPVAEGYQYDYWQGFIPDEDDNESVVVGESKVNQDPRIPATPGAALLQSLIDRELIITPVPPEAPFNGIPESDRDKWEQQGGVYAAGEHLRIASLRDIPEFIPTAAQNPYTGELEMEFLPGIGDELVESTTWEDHLVIVNALKAHYDHAYISNATRVLMYASGSILDGCEFETIPKKFIVKGVKTDSGDPIEDIENSVGFQGPLWPEESEKVENSILVLNYPKLVVSYPLYTSYRTTINSDRVNYPYLDYPDIATVFITDGFLSDCATANLDQHAALDWVMSDPCEAVVQFFDMYRNHLDDRSY